MPTTIYRRALQYSTEEWERLDRLSIDPMDSGHVGMLANLLMCHSSRIEKAVAKAGPKIRNIRRYSSSNHDPNRSRHAGAGAAGSNV